MRRLVPFCVLAAAAGCAAATVLLLAPGPGEAEAPAAAGFLSPREARFGDRISAALRVPRSATVSARFAPYTVLQVRRRPHVTVYTLQCLSAECLPGPGERVFRFPPARVDGTSVAWPDLNVAPRVAPGDLRRPRFRGDLTAEPASGPWTLGWTLAGAASALLLAAGVWASFLLRPRRGLRLGHGAPPLHAALRPVEHAQELGPQERRTALDFLALALDDAGHGKQARRARALAWSPDAPDEKEMAALARSAREAA